MTTSIVRLAIIYVLLSIFSRLMGKRQLGDMHPAEFVITVLLSEIAASCAVDRNISLLKSVSAAAVLVSFEIISSFIAM